MVGKRNLDIPPIMGNYLGYANENTLLNTNYAANEYHNELCVSFLCMLLNTIYCISSYKKISFYSNIFPIYLYRAFTPHQPLYLIPIYWDV